MDIVEIKTNKNSGPSEGWLKFVRTAGARNKIRQYITKHEEENKKQIIEEGRRLLKEWGIEEDYEGIGNVIIGFADGKAPEAAPRLDHRVITIE